MTASLRSLAGLSRKYNTESHSSGAPVRCAIAAGARGKRISTRWRLCIHCARMKPLVFLVRAFAALAFIQFFIPAGEAQTNLPSLELRNVFPDLKFNRPLWLEEIPDGSKRLVVVEQGGIVYLLPKGRDSKEALTFLDISDRKPYRENEEG